MMRDDMRSKKYWKHNTGESPEQKLWENITPASGTAGTAGEHGPKIHPPQGDQNQCLFIGKAYILR